MRTGLSEKLFKQAEQLCSIRYRLFTECPDTRGRSGANEASRQLLQPSPCQSFCFAKVRNSEHAFTFTPQHCTVTQVTQIRVLGAVGGDGAGHQNQNVEIHVGARSSYERKLQLVVNEGRPSGVRQGLQGCTASR